MSTDAVHVTVEIPARGALRSRVSEGAAKRLFPDVKRILDIALALTLLVFTGPVLAIAALALALQGPVFFTQLRVGRGDTRFRCFKLRTMYVDAEARLAACLAADPDARRDWDRHQKLKSDPRITRLGRLLRRCSLDEVPQVFNVLRGEMSFVGPRPIIAPEIAGYGADAEYHRSAAFADYARCRPGITGLWQVSGRHRTTPAERRRLDRIYAQSRSLWLDAYILTLTVGVVLSLSGR